MINPDASTMPVRVTIRAWLLPRQVLIGLVKGYRLLLSPWLGSSCRFEPTCSIYAIESYERHGAVVGSALTASRLLRCQPWCEGGHDPVPVAARLSSSRLLWAVFGISLVMLWDQWQIHNGNAPLFFSQGATQQASGAGSSGVSATTANNMVPAGSSSAVSATAQTLPGAVPEGVTQELVTVSSDVLDLTFDAVGGNLVGAQLLKHSADVGGKKGQTQALTLLTQSAAHTYVVQSGLVGGKPNHITRMTPVVRANALTSGQDSLEVRFESEVVGGLQLIKTYTVKRGDYTLDVRFDVLNKSDQTQSPELYVQLARDGMSAESETPFYKTFTGPAFYSDEEKYQKVDFEDIAKNDTSFVATTSSGFVAMVQHYFASAWVLPAGQLRENYVARFASGIYTAGSKAQMGSLAPGATQTLQTRLFVGPQQETMLETVTPGLELVKDYGWVTILAKPLYWLLDKIHGFVGNWGWAIMLLVVLIKAAFYWLNAKAYQSMGKMKALSPRIAEMRERKKSHNKFSRR